MSLGLLTRGYIAPAGSGGTDVEPPIPPTPIAAPFEPGDTEYVDHEAEMMSRLVYQLARVG